MGQDSFEEPVIKFKEDEGKIRLREKRNVRKEFGTPTTTDRSDRYSSPE
jgi:hypothetical protein